MTKKDVEILEFEYTFSNGQLSLALIAMFFCAAGSLWMIFSKHSPEFIRIAASLIALYSGYYVLLMGRSLLYGGATGEYIIKLMPTYFTAPKWSMFRMWQQSTIEYMEVPYTEIKSIEAFIPRAGHISSWTKTLLVTTTQGIVNVHEADLGTQQFELLVSELQKRKQLVLI